MTKEQMIEMATRLLGNRAEAIKLVEIRIQVEAEIHKLLTEHSKSHTDGSHNNTTCPLTTNAILEELFPFVSKDEVDMVSRYVIIHLMDGQMRRSGFEMPKPALIEMAKDVEDIIRTMLWLLQAMNSKAPASGVSDA